MIIVTPERSEDSKCCNYVQPFACYALDTQATADYSAPLHLKYFGL
jgi:hypothetical protein